MEYNLYVHDLTMKPHTGGSCNVQLLLAIVGLSTVNGLDWWTGLKITFMLANENSPVGLHLDTQPLSGGLTPKIIFMVSDN